MHIHNHAYLFLCAKIDFDSKDFGLPRRSYAEGLESFCEAFLQNHSLLRRMCIVSSEKLFDKKKIFIIREKIGNRPLKESFPTSPIEKVIEVSLKIGLFLIFGVPFLLLKAAIWAYDFSYIKQRNELIFEALKQQDAFLQMQARSEQLNQFKPTLSFKEANSQEDCPLLKLPLDIQKAIWNLLDRKAYYAVAQVCKKTFASIRETPREFIDEDFPKGIVRALGKEKLQNLPFGYLPLRWDDIMNAVLEKSPSLHQYSTDDCGNLFSNVLKAHQQYTTALRYFSYNRVQNIPTMSIERILCPQGRGLRLMLNNEAKDFSMIFLKTTKGWTLFTDSANFNLLLFLRDLCFHEEAPFAEDYLRRLSEGAPCSPGFVFTPSFTDRTSIDYKTEKASEILQEFPFQKLVKLASSEVPLV